jgi:dihydrofolate reductase
MIISQIVAAATNNAIGKNNQMLWSLPNDFRFFKNTTWGMPVIMGRKTFESLGKELKGRTNIVVTSNKSWQAEGAVTAASLDEALAKAGELATNEIFIIGGGQIYKESFSITNRVYMTRVHAEFEADAFFPAIDPNEWKLVSKHDCFRDEKHAYDYSFEVWDRKIN